jgi:hypothetical protein
MTSTVKVRIPGKGNVTLTSKDYLATGGEGTVYVKSGLVYKLYLDPVAARARGIEEKVKLLAQVRHPYVVSPLGVLENDKQEVVGFYMEEAPGVPLVKTFTNAWRDPNGFGLKESLALVENMRKALCFVHQAGAVTVDANEMNYLAHGVEPRLLDVDSWQIGRFKASAVMPSIRDPHAKVFDEGSDWFAWAVVTFQVLTGIHPYKGTHPSFKRGDLAARMAANVSVLDPTVSTNAGVRDFSDIPGHLLDWYRDVFQAGRREAPPSVTAPTARKSPSRKKAAQTSPSRGLNYEMLLELPGRLRMLLPGGFAILETAERVLFDLQRRVVLEGAPPDAVAAVLSHRAAVLRTASATVLAQLTSSGIRATTLRGPREPVPPSTAQQQELPFLASELRAWDGRLFALSRDSETGLSELQVDALGGQTLLSIKGSWPFLARSARIFGSMAVFDALGAPYLVLPLKDSVYVERCPSLRGHEVLDALALSPDRALVIALKKNDGQLYRMTLARQVDGSFGTAIATLTDMPKLNAALSEKGLLLCHGEQSELLLSLVSSDASKTLTGTGLDPNCELFALPSGFHIVRDSRLLRISMAP